MGWIVFAYSLPSKLSSSPRVTLWRRLRRIGAIAISSVQILPDQDHCLEAFQWLAQEVRQANGEALIMQVDGFEGVSDQSIVKKFREVRQEDYAALETKIVELENALTSLDKVDNSAPIREALEKLYKQHADIQQIDFFDCPEQEKIADRLKRLTKALLPSIPVVSVTPKNIEDYRHARWITRPRPHVDRLACIWFIRRFINPNATIRYARTVHDNEVAFDMDQGEFRHQGNWCSFEVMVQSFGLDDAGLQTLSEIVHEIDLRDGSYQHPQIAGVDTLLRGWLLAGFADTDLETHGIALFEGLYAASLQTATNTTKLTSTHKKSST